MATSYALHLNPQVTPPTQPILGKDQIQNNTGGFVFEISPLAQLKRFLIIGNEQGTYYEKPQAMTVKNAQNVVLCLQSEGKASVDMIVDVSTRGIAPKNDAAIFALALATKYGDLFTRRYAWDNLYNVCRTGTHLFQFREVYKILGGGTGRCAQRALTNWYLRKTPDELAYQLLKYRQRSSWTHRDIFRLVKPNNVPEDKQDIVSWVVGKNTNPQHPMVKAFEEAKTLSTNELVAHIKTYGLTREMLPSEQLSKPEILAAMLPNTKLESLIRNLGNLGKAKLLLPMSEVENYVVARLTDQVALKRARMHPIKLLLAMKTYAQGHGQRGSGEWLVCPRIVDALEQAFYSSFTYAEGIGNKRTLIGLDVSGSMGYTAVSSTLNNLSCREAAMALCMSLVKSEQHTYVNGFANTFIPIAVSAQSRLKDACQLVTDIPFGSTDCSLPMLHALEHKIPVDVFVVFTDNEVNCGKMHPSQALKKYRAASGINSKLVVCTMTATNFTIADPSDIGMLDIPGLSADIPAVIREFSNI